MRSENERFLDMLEAIDRIQDRMPGSLDMFADDELVQVWMVHHLQIIGEAAFKISKETQNKYSHIAWGNIIGTRHILVHNYFEIDLEIVWNVLIHNLPVLREQIEEILKTDEPE
jgi:uncharacterized protein with HEPN domain